MSGVLALCRGAPIKTGMVFGMKGTCDRLDQAALIVKKSGYFLDGLRFH